MDKIASKGSMSLIGTAFNLVQRLYSDIPYRHLKNGYALPPWHFIIEPTRRCNLRCKMCQYITWLEEVPVSQQKEGELSAEEWMSIIRQIHRFSLITFTGGELFLRKDFPDMLRYASTRCYTHIISNMTLVNEERANFLCAQAPRFPGLIGLNFLGTSVEGTREVHDSIRGAKGAFDKTIAAVRMLREARDASGKRCPLIHVTTVMQQANVHVLPEMPRIVKEAGADVVNFVTESRIQDTPGVGVNDPRTIKHEDVPWATIDTDQLKAALEEAIHNAQELDIQLRLPRMPFRELLRFYQAEPLDLAQYECRGPWNLLGLGPKGEVGSCPYTNLGNLKDTPFKELWNSVKQREFRQQCKKGLYAACPGCCLMDHRNQRDAAAGFKEFTTAGSTT